MKEIVKFDQAIGGDGAKAAGALSVDGDQLKAHVQVTYPIAKIVEPATKAVDSLLDKVEKLIPGGWDKPFIETIKVEYKEELMKLIGAQVQPAQPADQAPQA